MISREQWYGGHRFDSIPTLLVKLRFDARFWTVKTGRRSGTLTVKIPSLDTFAPWLNSSRGIGHKVFTVYSDPANFINVQIKDNSLNLIGPVVAPGDAIILTLLSYSSDGVWATKVHNVYP